MIDQELLTGYSDINAIRSALEEEYQKFILPVGLTINFHRQIKSILKTSSYKRSIKRSISLSDIELFWDVFTGNLRSATTFSNERNKKDRTLIGFGNIDIGRIENQIHFHGVINNPNNAPVREFNWIIKQAIYNACEFSPIVCGQPYIETKLIDIGWAGYCFKNNGLCYPLFGK